MGAAVGGGGGGGTAVGAGAHAASAAVASATNTRTSKIFFDISILLFDRSYVNVFQCDARLVFPGITTFHLYNVHLHVRAIALR